MQNIKGNKNMCLFGLRAACVDVRLESSSVLREPVTVSERLAVELWQPVLTT